MCCNQGTVATGQTVTKLYTNSSTEASVIGTFPMEEGEKAGHVSGKNTSPEEQSDRDHPSEVAHPVGQEEAEKDEDLVEELESVL